MVIENILTPGQKISLTLVIIGLLVNGVLLFFTKKQWQTIDQKKIEIEQQEDRAVIVEQLDKERLIIGDRFEKLLNFLPSNEEEIAKVAQELEAVAKTSGVDLKLTFEDFPENIDIGGQYQQGLKTNAEIGGSYQGVINWVREIQQLPYFIRFSEVKIGVTEEQSGIKTEFKGTIFLRNAK